MNILILDDDENRHQIFDKIYKNHNVTHVHGFASCIEALKQGDWDLVHLDHDLGIEVENPDMKVDGWGRAVEYTGLDVVRWLADRLDYDLVKKIIVHSMNPPGGFRMYGELADAGFDVTYAPFDKNYLRKP